MEVTDVGRFGTLSLLRRLPVESVATSYPIDDEELTIGRDQACSLRLYYPAVSALHAKITFVERKAFLVVLGTNGLLLDDAPLFPAAATAPGPTTVPLQNNSVIEIHKKRFRFTYPPKHLRPALINTPSRATPMASRRPLRMSMIASAHVFSPRPSEDPRENLRVLQSPLRTPFAAADEEIVLVHSDTPRVVEEDKDLIILDEVEPEPEPILPLPVPIAAQAPRTPARRPRPSLHRVVLMRSAQRAAIQREIQMEEEQEVEEVEETIAAIAEVDEGDEEIQELPSPHAQTQPQVTGWRKSLDLVRGGLGWALRGLSVEPKEEEQEPDMDQADEEVQEYAEDDDEDMHEHEEHDEHDDYVNENYDEQVHEEEHEYEEERDVPRPLGRFMSPQIPRTTNARQPRMSLGVGHDTGPRRVRLVAPWKVTDIEVPDTVKEEEGPKLVSNTPASPATPRSPVKREKLTEEEREAIRARRRSALATPDNFFKGQAPGSRRTLFPNLAPLPSPNFVQPQALLAEQPQSPATLVKDETPSASTASGSSVKLEDDEKEDTAVLLARMKQMVEGVKQRQSLGRQSLNLSPRKREGGFSLLAPGHATAHAPSRILIEEDEPAAPAQPSDEEDVEMHDDDLRPDPTGRRGSGREQPETPRMSDLRHVFGRARAEPSTPAFTGVRDMFRVQPQGPMDTPRMDGMKELLTTPAGYRPASPERRVAQTEQSADAPRESAAQEAEEEVDQPVATIPARAARGRKAAGTSRIARRTTVPAPARSTRAGSQALEEAGEGDDHATRRTRARTADGTVGQATRTTRAKPTEAKPATPEPQEDEGTQAHPTTAARTTRRTRQATDSSTTSSHSEDIAAAPEPKPTRKTRAKTPTPAPATKPSTARRGTRAKPIEVPEDDGEDDPLDSLSREDGPAEEEPPVPAPRARRGTRSKIPMGAVKEEDVEPSLSAEKADEGAPRATRSRRTPVPRQPTPSGTGAGTRTGTRTRGGSTTAAAAPAVGTAVEPAIPEDKENTPEANDEEEDHHEEAKAPAARARAATGKTTKRVKKEPAEAGEDALPAATRTRVTRTRAARS
ncbi:hypothetical protein GY45DRAFT_1274435 [Cubamyces sp. BRFM 1775]|nr:hypothetical protein GY45DRAFT_1274435 [Cubamyces sp. BRFM 1775]